MPAKKTGVKSAGNVPVMGAPIIDWFFANDLSMMNQVLTVSTLITHTDSRAIEGTWIIAMAARYITNNSYLIASVNGFFKEILPTLKGEELKNIYT